MSNTILRDVVLIGLMAIGTAALISNRTWVYDKLGLAQNTEIAPNSDLSSQAPKTERLTAVVRPSGTVVSIQKSKTDGQFWTDARVNSGHVRFLVDTGASAVALTMLDAKKAGIRTHELTFDVPVETAGGRNFAAYVELDSISVGAITIRNVKALVIPEGLNTSLLGMTYLGQLQKVEATPTSLLLRL